MPAQQPNAKIPLPVHEAKQKVLLPAQQTKQNNIKNHEF